MSKPESRGPRRAPLFKSQLNAFFFFIGGTGAAMAVAHRAQLRRSTFHPKRQEDDSFAKRWAWVLDVDLECPNTRKERPAWHFHICLRRGRHQVTEGVATRPEPPSIKSG